jgi:hypothetical protein
MNSRPTYPRAPRMATVVDIGMDRDGWMERGWIFDVKSHTHTHTQSETSNIEKHFGGILTLGVRGLGQGFRSTRVQISMRARARVQERLKVQGQNIHQMHTF